MNTRDDDVVSAVAVVADSGGETAADVDDDGLDGLDGDVELDANGAPGDADYGPTALAEADADGSADGAATDAEAGAEASPEASEDA